MTHETTTQTQNSGGPRRPYRMRTPTTTKGGDMNRPPDITEGRWVRAGLIWRWDGPRPAETDYDKHAGRQRRDDGAFIKGTFYDDDPRHGTPAGYKAHLRHKVPTCDHCRDAYNTWQSEKYYQGARHRLDQAVIERVLSGDMPSHVSPAERKEICRRWVEEEGRTLRSLERITGWRTSRYYRHADQREQRAA